MNASAKFDLSDVSVTPPEDTLDDVLAIAAEVLAEFGESPRRTRIERLAQWLIMNVGGEPHQTETVQGGAERYRAHEHAYPIIRVGSIFAIEKVVEEPGRTCTPLAIGTEAARAIAVAILRSCERDD